MVERANHLYSARLVIYRYDDCSQPPTCYVTGEWPDSVALAVSAAALPPGRYSFVHGAWAQDERDPAPPDAPGRGKYPRPDSRAKAARELLRSRLADQGSMQRSELIRAVMDLGANYSYANLVVSRVAKELEGEVMKVRDGKRVTFVKRAA